MESESLAKAHAVENGEKAQNCEDFEEILKLVGSQGRYQKFLVYVVLCPLTAIQAWLAMNNIFLFSVPDHWCHVPGMGNGTDISYWKNLTLPIETGPNGLPRLSQCSMYDQFGEITPCQYGWEYDKTDYETTMSTEFNWVCTKSDYPTQIFTVAAAGGAIGQMGFGMLADRFGRRPMYFVSLFINVFFKFISYFFPQWFLGFLIANFISASGFPLMFIAPAMIAAEVCDNGYRSWVYSISWAIWVGGLGTLPLIAWISRTWILTAMITTIPGFILFIAYYKVIPESSRWLLSVGRLDDAKNIILTIAKTNGNPDAIPDDKLEKMIKGVYDYQRKTDENSAGVWTLFSRGRLGLNTLMLAISWSVNTLIYEGITLNTPNMSGNQFINFFVLSLVEIPGTMVGAYLLDKAGRRWTQAAFFVLGAVSSFVGAVVVLYPSLSGIAIASVIVSKFCVTLTFLVVFLQCTELFPTYLRSTGNSVVFTIGAVLGIFGPQVVYAGQFYAGAPYLFLGGFCLLGVVASSILPETLNQNLPETLEDATHFGKNHKFWSFLPKQQQKSVELSEKI